VLHSWCLLPSIPHLFPWPRT